MVTIRLYAHFIIDLGSTLMLALTTGAVSSILGASMTRTLEGALGGAALGVLLGTFGFGYVVWQTYKPQLKAGRLAA